MPFCKITIAKFEGNEIGEEFEKKDLEGNLEEQIKAADTVLNLYLKTRVRCPFRAESAYCILSGKDGLYDPNWNWYCENNQTFKRAYRQRARI